MHNTDPPDLLRKCISSLFPKQDQSPSKGIQTENIPSQSGSEKDASEKVDVHNTDPPELLKKSISPFPKKQGLKGLLSPTQKRCPAVHR